MEKLTYREIKNKYGSPYGRDSVFIDFYTCALSPFFTKIAIQLNLIPNTVTFGMIISGLIGAALFWIPNVYIRIIGVVFIHLWFILDCSDGEVARITKHYSKYGEELDYMAHTINHPLFMLSFLIAIYCDEILNVRIIIAMFLTVAADFMLRIVYTFRHIDAIRYNTKESRRDDRSKFSRKEIIIFIINIFAQFPNFALIYPIIYLINREVGICYMYVNAAVAFMYSGYVAFSWLKRIHKL